MMRRAKFFQCRSLIELLEEPGEADYRYLMREGAELAQRLTDQRDQLLELWHEERNKRISVENLLRLRREAS